MKRKTLLIIVLIFTFYFSANGQSSNIGDIGITFSSLGSSEIAYYEDVVGTGGYEGENFFSAGITYIHPLNNWLEIESGVEYSEFAVTVTPPFYPGMNNESTNTEVSLLNIPVTVRANFLNYFYANGGILVDIELKNSDNIDDNSGLAIENQSGVGGMVGVGAKYDFDFGASLFVNPYFKMHSIIPKGQFDQRILESAIRFGITYQL